MKVFISWSGDRSKAVAFELQQWLQEVIQAAEPWMSTDIAKGRKWLDELNAQLSTSRVAILCLTRSALSSPWMHYEAGAIAKTEDALVCNLLIDIDAEKVTYPLAQFQATRTTKEDMRRLLHSINQAVGRSGDRMLTENLLDRIFERSWDRFSESISAILEAPDSLEIEANSTDELELDPMDEFIGVTLLSRSDSPWSLEELVPAVVRKLSPGTKTPPPAALAMMASTFEKKNLARMIACGFIVNANNRYSLTKDGQSHFGTIAKRVRAFQQELIDTGEKQDET